MAFVAANLRMLTCKRKTRFGVVELLYIHALPIAVVMTLQAVCAEPPLVLVFVAGNAGLAKRQESAVQIRDFDLCLVGDSNMRWVVAAAALQPSVLALKCVSRLLVIENFCVPLNQREVFPVVVGVATDALLAGAWLHVVSGVQAFTGSEARRDLTMTVETAKCSFSSGKLMAASAIGGAVQGLVSAREWSG
jgi:hypothetical protein